MSYFPYRVSLVLIKASCCTITSSIIFVLCHARCKCHNSLSVCVLIGLIATEGTYAMTSGKGHLVLGGLSSPTLPEIPQQPQSYRNW